MDPRVTLLRETMREQGRQSLWMGRHLGLPKSTLSRYLNGQRRMPEDQLERAMQLVGLTYRAPDVPSGTDLVPAGRDDDGRAA